MMYILIIGVVILLGFNQARGGSPFTSDGLFAKVVLDIVSAAVDKRHCKWRMCEVTGGFEVEEDGR